jgi:hypothetical protein
VIRTTILHRASPVDGDLNARHTLVASEMSDEDSQRKNGAGDGAV